MAPDELRTEEPKTQDQVHGTNLELELLFEEVLFKLSFPTSVRLKRSRI